MYKHELTISNESSKEKSIWIEPWAFSYEIPAGAKCKFSADSEIEGEFELIENDTDLEIYGWCGSNLKIYINDILEWDTKDLRVPSLPSGMSTKDFVGMVFDNDPLTSKPKS